MPLLSKPIPNRSGKRGWPRVVQNLNPLGRRNRVKVGRREAGRAGGSPIGFCVGIVSTLLIGPENKALLAGESLTVGRPVFRI